LGKLAVLSGEPVSLGPLGPHGRAAFDANQQKKGAALLLHRVKAVLWGRVRSSAKEELVYLNMHFRLRVHQRNGIHWFMFL